LATSTKKGKETNDHPRRSRSADVVVILIGKEVLVSNLGKSKLGHSENRRILIITNLVITKGMETVLILLGTGQKQKRMGRPPVSIPCDLKPGSGFPVILASTPVKPAETAIEGGVCRLDRPLARSLLSWQTKNIECPV
jgi:hypothetical protein